MGVRFGALLYVKILQAQRDIVIINVGAEITKCVSLCVTLPIKRGKCGLLQGLLIKLSRVRFPRVSDKNKPLRNPLNRRRKGYFILSIQVVFLSNIVAKICFFMPLGVLPYVLPGMSSSIFFIVFFLIHINLVSGC